MKSRKTHRTRSEIKVFTFTCTSTTLILSVFYNHYLITFGVPSLYQDTNAPCHTTYAYCLKSCHTRHSYGINTHLLLSFFFFLPFDPFPFWLKVNGQLVSSVFFYHLLMIHLAGLVLKWMQSINVLTSYYIIALGNMYRLYMYRHKYI